MLRIGALDSLQISVTTKKGKHCCPVGRLTLKMKIKETMFAVVDDSKSIEKLLASSY